VRVDTVGCHVETRLTPGRWRFSFQAPGYALLRRDVALEPSADVDLGQLRLEAPTEVTVRVLDPGGRLAPSVRVALLASDRAEWGPVDVVTTGADGIASFTGLAAEPLVVAAADPRFASVALAVEPRASSGPARVELRLEPGVAVALDFGHRPEAGARVVVRDAAGRAVVSDWVPGSGLVPLRLRPGDYVVEVEGAGSARAFTVTDESAVFDVR
jgi:hypothetical protein